MSSDPLIGRTLANYRIDRPIGRGGMAQIYYGMDTALDRPVAIKVIDARFQGDPEYARRFVDEAKIVARWKHENIVSVYYADNEEGLYYFAMEFIDGAGLDELLESYFSNGELMPHADVLRIGKAMAKALDYAHQQGIVHRDFKPSNVMISRNDRVILADFGLALDINQGSMGQIFGTPHYIAPEQARRSSDAVPQSDIYALGVVLYEMLTGAVPFDDESAMAVAVQHMSEPPPAPRTINPDLSMAVEEVLLKALEKEPQNRYSSGADLMEALEYALKHGDAEETQPSSPAIMPPAAISGRNAKKKLSNTSISDMLAVELDSRPPISPPAAVSPQQAATRQHRPPHTAPTVRNETVAAKHKNGGNRMIAIAIGAIIVLVLIAGGAFLVFGGGDSGDEVDSADTETQSFTETELTLDDTMGDSNLTGTAEALAIEATSVAAQSVPSNTPVSDAPTTIPVAVEPTVDTAATNQAELIMRATQNMLTITAMTQVVQLAEPTVAFPNGHPIEMTYNSAGFYLQNNSDTNIRMSRLNFFALNSEGSPTGNSFEGVNWARFYNFIDRNGRCVAIELTDQPSWTRPTDCVAAAGNAFNSLLTFTEGDGQIFWTPLKGATQFAVLWDGTEIIRCQIADGLCLVNVGN